MKAAGIITKYLYIAIRGISDYADSYKNDAWQYYTAAAAAGYAKKLLSYVASPKPFTTTAALGHYIPKSSFSTRESTA
jgi:hypothetical protein